MKELRDVLVFWFDEIDSSYWFKKDDNFDQKIREKFLPIYNKYKEIQLDEITDAQISLALIIVFDQFSRNMFRGTAKSFATDNLALKIAKYAIKNNYHKEVEKNQSSAFYMPFMHSENIEDQNTCVELFRKDQGENKWAVDHQKIIARFGRFPHRNEILGRESTTEELEFLKEEGSSF